MIRFLVLLCFLAGVVWTPRVAAETAEDPVALAAMLVQDGLTMALRWLHVGQKRTQDGRTPPPKMAPCCPLPKPPTSLICNPPDAR